MWVHLQPGNRSRSEVTHAVFVKLVASERRDAGFDSSGAKSDEEEPDHGESAATHQRAQSQTAQRELHSPAHGKAGKSRCSVTPT